jgi:FHS family L-fucose permease-like MFS transporter
MAIAPRGAAYAIVTCLFFAWGFITSLVDPLVAAVKGIFHLSDVEAQLECFGLLHRLWRHESSSGRNPHAHQVRAVGPDLTGNDGRWLPDHVLAANLAVYEIVLLGLFVMASGITVLQSCSKPTLRCSGCARTATFA